MKISRPNKSGKPGVKKHEVDLKVLPADVVFKGRLATKIKYDKTRKKLVFSGSMTEKEEQELNDLSQNKKYLNAIEKLADKSSPKRTHIYAINKEMLLIAVRMALNPDGITTKDVKELMADLKGYITDEEKKKCLRTAERRIKAIKDIYKNGVQEIGEKGIDIRRKVIKSALSLYPPTEEEIQAIKAAIDIVKREGIPGLADALESIYERAYKSQKGIHEWATTAIDPLDQFIRIGLAMRPGPRVKVNNDVMNQLHKAIESSRIVTINYEPTWKENVETYDIKPYGFLFGSRHYLIADKVGYSGKAQWRLDYITKVTITDKEFSRPAGDAILEYAQRSFGSYQEKPFDVVWVFDQVAAPRAAEFIFHPTQKVRKLPDGKLEVKFAAGGLMEMAWHLNMWGEHVKVKKPDGFWKEYERRKQEGALP